MMMRMIAAPISSIAYGAASIRSRLARELGPSLDLKPRTSSGVGVLDDHAVNILIGVTSMLLVLCIVAVGGRLLARRMSKVSLEADDYLVVVALSLVIALSIEQFMLALYGKGSSSTKVRTLTQLEQASQLTYALLITTVKLSILMLYRRVFSLRVQWFRNAWWANVLLAISIGLVLLILGVTGCSPHPLSQIVDMRSSCKRNSSAAAVMGFMNAASDFLILVLPIRMCWSLQLSRKNKYGLLAVFGLCLITIAVSIARAIAIVTGGISTKSGMALNFIIWSTTEPEVALICACLPPMRKLFIARAAKASSYVGAVRLELRSSQRDGSISMAGLSPANRKSAHEVRASLSRKPPTSSQSENSRRWPPKGSQNENGADEDSRVVSAADSDAYAEDQVMKPGFKTPETPKEARSSWSESGSDTPSFNERDIASVRSNYGRNVKRPG